MHTFECPRSLPCGAVRLLFRQLRLLPMPFLPRLKYPVVKRFFVELPVQGRLTLARLCLVVEWMTKGVSTRMILPKIAKQQGKMEDRVVCIAQ